MSRYTAGKNAGAPMSRLDVVGERNSSLGYRSPVNFERAHARSVAGNQSFCRLTAADCAAV